MIEDVVFIFEQFSNELTTFTANLKNAILLGLDGCFHCADVAFDDVPAVDGTEFFLERIAELKANRVEFELRFWSIRSVLESEKKARSADKAAKLAGMSDPAAHAGTEFQGRFTIQTITFAVDG